MGPEIVIVQIYRAMAPVHTNHIQTHKSYQSALNLTFVKTILRTFLIAHLTQYLCTCGIIYLNKYYSKTL